MMESAEIARRFLSYFERHGHTVVPSASLIADDPTLLAGECGHESVQAPISSASRRRHSRGRPARRMRAPRPTSREVGKTTRHGTFFQMLGNFSFGDYFKDRAIPMRGSC